jgi:hypothetical protein
LTSLERGLDGVLVSVSRVLEASKPSGLSPEHGAGQIETEHDAVLATIDALVARVKRASDEGSSARARQRLLNRLGQWIKRRQHLAGKSVALVYERVTDEAQFGPLIISAENARAFPDGKDTPPFVVANSMREVQAEINLLVSPVKERLYIDEPPGSPQWEMPHPEEAL